MKTWICNGLGVRAWSIGLWVIIDGAFHIGMESGVLATTTCTPSPLKAHKYMLRDDHRVGIRVHGTYWDGIRGS